MPKGVVGRDGARCRVVAGVAPPLLGEAPVTDAAGATLRVVDGTRYSFPGDLAVVEEDGSISLLGRGSQCTVGEKVFPEELEEAEAPPEVR